MRRFFIVLMLLLQGLLPAGSKREKEKPVPVLRALLIQDTIHQQGAAASSYDVARMQRALKNIAAQAGLALSKKVLDVGPATKGAVAKWATALPEKSNDVVFVYYAGPGIGAARATSPWPAIPISFNKVSGVPSDEDALPQEQVAQLVQRRSPRLAIIFFDCYNAICPLSEAGSKAYFLADIPTKSEPLPGLAKLFLGTKGVIKLCSTPRAANGKAFCNEEKGGGMVTEVFLLATRELAKQGDLTWDHLIDRFLDGWYNYGTDFKPLVEAKIANVGTGTATNVLVPKRENNKPNKPPKKPKKKKDNKKKHTQKPRKHKHALADLASA